MPYSKHKEGKKEEKIGKKMKTLVAFKRSINEEYKKLDLKTQENEMNESNNVIKIKETK